MNLEKLALKKSSNNEVFSYIKKLFDKSLNEKEFKTVNESKNFSLKDGTITKLRKKYTNLKVEWRKISDPAKLGSGLAPVLSPNWYKHVNGIYSETNAELDLAAEAGGLCSFSSSIRPPLHIPLFVSF